MGPLRGSIVLLAAWIALPLEAPGSPYHLSKARRFRLPSDSETSLSLGYDSRYVSAGETFGSDAFWTSLDASLPWSETFSVELSAAAVEITAPADDFGREFDLNLSLTKELNFDTWLSAVISRYSYYGDIPDEAEMGVEWEHYWRGFDLALWYGFELESSSHYMEINVSRAFAVSDWIEIIPSAQAGADLAPEGARTDFTHLSLRIDLWLECGKHCTLIPYISASWPLHGVNEEENRASERFGGAQVSLRF